METNSTPDQPESETQGAPAAVLPRTEAAAPATPQQSQPELALLGTPDATPPGAAPAPEAQAEPDELTALAIRSQAARLPVADEERMGALLKESLLSGKAGVLKVVELLPKLPWIVGIRAVENSWPEMKATGRGQLLKGLAEIESDSARRIRLSLARALFKLDPATCLKLTVGVCKEMREKETGALTQKNAQIFANVFIGKIKPWLALLPLADMKAPDGELLVHCALIAVFSLPHPPVTQLGVLRWAGEAGRLSKLQDVALNAVTRNTSRWSSKWQAALRKEVANLPEEILGTLKPLLPENTESTSDSITPEERLEAQESADGQDSADDAPDASEEGARATSEQAPITRKERPIYEPRPQKPIEPQRSREGGGRERGRDRGRGRDRNSNRDSDRNSEPQRDVEQGSIENERAPRDNERGSRDNEARKERPVYQPRNAGTAQNFNLSETLRQIEAHVQSLRTELTAAQSKARQKDDDLRPNRRQPERPAASSIPGEPTVEELARLNLQLESRITELQLRITELGTDAEDRAASIGAHDNEQITDVNQQLRTLLGYKLQEDFADYEALQNESTSVVVQQHYRSLLGHIFEVLATEGIRFKSEAS